MTKYDLDTITQKEYQILVIEQENLVSNDPNVRAEQDKIITDIMMINGIYTSCKKNMYIVNSAQDDFNTIYTMSEQIGFRINDWLNNKNERLAKIQLHSIDEAYRFIQKIKDRCLEQINYGIGSQVHLDLMNEMARFEHRHGKLKFS